MKLNESIRMPKAIERDLDTALEITWDDFTETIYDDTDYLATFGDVFGNFVGNSNIHEMLLNNIKLFLSAIKYVPLDVLYAQLDEDGFNKKSGYKDICDALTSIYWNNYADMHRDEFEEIVSVSNDLDAANADIMNRSKTNYESLRRNKRRYRK